jgi:uncharacterized protein YdeI (YjbR/CyaY-like superfamily)
MKSSDPKPIKIPDELIERCDGADQFEQFDKLFRAVISVPRSEILKERAKWKREHTRKKQPKKSAWIT